MADRECTLEVKSSKSFTNMECKDVNEKVETKIPQEVRMDFPEITMENMHRDPTELCYTIDYGATSTLRPGLARPWPVWSYLALRIV